MSRRQLFTSCLLIWSSLVWLTTSCIARDQTNPISSATFTPTPMVTHSPATATATSSLAATATATLSPTPIILTETPILGSQRLIAFAALPTQGDSINSDIYIMRPDGTQLINLTQHPARDQAPVWSPDGRQIAFLSNRDGPFDLYVMNADGTDVLRLTHNANATYKPSWNPSLKHIAFSARYDSDHDSVYVLDMNNFEVKSLITEGSTYNHSPAWSPDGTMMAFVSDRDSGVPQIFILDLSNEAIRQLTKGVEPNSDPAWSPDSSQIAYTCISPRAGVICVTSLDGTQTKRLIDPDQFLDGYEPAWSPDGTRIAFRSIRDFATVPEANFAIYVMSADGSGVMRITDNLALNSETPSWQP